MKIYLIFLLIGFAPISFAQELKLFSEEELAKKPVYTTLGRAFQAYEQAYRLTLKGTGGYYGKIDAVHPDIDSLKYLQSFQVTNEKLSDLPPSFGNLEYLQQLYLSGNQFEQIPDTIFNLKNLKRLDFRANRLVSIPEKIAQLSKLEYLYLNDNRDLTTLPLDAILKLKNLKVINTKNTQIPRAQMQQIQAALPEASVEY